MITCFYNVLANLFLTMMMIMMDDHNDDDNNDNNNNISDTFKGAFHTTIRQMKQMSLYFSFSVVNVGN